MYLLSALIQTSNKTNWKGKVGFGGGLVASRVAHNQEVPSSIPAATKLFFKRTCCLKTCLMSAHSAKDWRKKSALLYSFNKFHKNWLGTKDIKKESTNYLEREVLRYFCQSGLTFPSLTLSWTRRLDTRLKSSQERDKNRAKEGET